MVARIGILPLAGIVISILVGIALGVAPRAPVDEDCESIPFSDTFT